MAVAGAGTAYRYRPHGAAGVCRSMAFPTPRGGAGSSLAPESSRPYGSGSAASSFSPAFAAAASGLLRQDLDVLDYLSDDGGGPAPAVPGTFSSPLPPRMPVDQAAPVVPDAGYGDFRCAAPSVSVAAGNKIAFRTRSEEEVLDDGYKWRKYGKNSPSPRLLSSTASQLLPLFSAAAEEEVLAKEDLLECGDGTQAQDDSSQVAV
ncbi:hypothetical protein ACQ4PT_036959 [Festuca glaucescens]